MTRPINRRPMIRSEAISERFWSKVDRHGPRAGRLGRCWVWTGRCIGAGYGVLHFDGSLQGQSFAHRWAWEEEHGPIPQGRLLHHLCSLLGGAGPPCVRPSHLRPVTYAEHLHLHAAA